MMRRLFFPIVLALAGGAACGPSDPGYTPLDAMGDARRDGGGGSDAVPDGGQTDGGPDLSPGDLARPDQAIAFDLAQSDQAVVPDLSSTD